MFYVTVFEGKQFLEIIMIQIIKPIFCSVMYLGQEISLLFLLTIANRSLSLYLVEGYLPVLIALFYFYPFALLSTICLPIYTAIFSMFSLQPLYIPISYLILNIHQALQLLLHNQLLQLFMAANAFLSLIA